MKNTINSFISLDNTLRTIDARISEIVNSLERPSCYVYLSAADKAELKDLRDAKYILSRLQRESVCCSVPEDFTELFKKKD